MNRSSQNIVSANHPGRNAPKDKREDSIDISVLLGTLWRGRWIIALTTLLGILLGGYYALSMAEPMYRSTAVVMLETRQEQVVDLQSVIGEMSGDAAEINSEIEVLRSRSLVGKVVDDLKLTDDPEFNSTLRDPSMKAAFSSFVRRLLGIQSGRDAISEEQRAERIRNLTIDSVLRHQSIRNVPQSLVFQITMVSEDPDKASLIADKLADTYIENQLAVKFNATEQATAWLSKRVSELQGELEDAESKLKDFSAGTDLIDRETLAAMERQLKDIRERILTATGSMTHATDQLAVMQAATTDEERAAAANDEQLNALLEELDNGTAEVAFDRRFAQLMARVQADKARAESQLQALETSRDALSQQIESQNADLITLQQLTREADASRLLYEHFLTRLKETAAQQGIQQADSRLLSDAVTPVKPYEPQTILIIVICGFLGMVLGAGLVLLREARQNTFRSARELEAETGYSVLGQIPMLPTRHRKDLPGYLASKPTSAAAEAIRNLRTSVMLSNMDTPPRIIAMTSSVPGEGKTTTALALAQNFKGMDKKVLLIEGDIRRRVFGQYLETKGKEGLLSVVAGESRLEDVVLHDPRIGADILIGEESQINAADFFASVRFVEFLEKVREIYDIVIIDTPPVLIVPDARVVAQYVDAMLFVVAWDRTSRPQVEEALHMFESTGQRISGLVLNQISAKGMQRYGYGGQYGSYAAYGSKYYTN